MRTSQQRFIKELPHIRGRTMPNVSPLETTSILNGIDDSDSARAVDSLIPLIYDELCEMAHRQLLNERIGHTLHTTELVHEAYLRLVDQTQITNRGRAYFFGAAAQAMRRVLIDHARKHRAAKRGGGEKPLRLEDQEIAIDEFASGLLSLDQTLTELARTKPRQAQIVELRFFAGLDVDEVGALLDLAPRTVRHYWLLARAHLYQILYGNELPLREA